MARITEAERREPELGWVLTVGADEAPASAAPETAALPLSPGEDGSLTPHGAELPTAVRGIAALVPQAPDGLFARRARSPLFALSLLIATATHAGGLLALTLSRVVEGAGGRFSEAVELEAIETEIIEAIPSSSDDGASSQSIQGEAGETVEGSEAREERRVSETEVVRREEPRPEPPKEPEPQKEPERQQLALADPSPTELEPEPLPQRLPDPPPPEAPPPDPAPQAAVPPEPDPPPPSSTTEPPPEPPQRDAPKSETPQTASDAGRQGGATARSQTGRAGSGGPAAAHPGQIATYHARLRSRIAAHRPSGYGKRGTVVVSFGIDAEGGLAFADVATSSGLATLDKAALAAIRRSAPFPRPPNGMTGKQLTFTVPFYFE